MLQHIVRYIRILINDQRHLLGAVKKNQNYAVPHPTIRVKCAVRCGKFLPIMRHMCGDFFEICAGIVRFSFAFSQGLWKF